MAAYSGAVPNLVGGVSQQPPEIRPINTAEDLQNSMCSVIAGLGKRPPFQYVFKTQGFSGNDTVAQERFKGPDGDYRLISVTDQDIKVLNLATNLEEPVTLEAGTSSYLPSVDSNANCGFLTVQDTVFIYNKLQNVSATSLSDSGRFDPTLWGTIWVKQTTAQSNYSVYINNTLVANVSTGTAQLSYDTSAVCNDIFNTLDGAGYEVYLNGSVIDIKLNANDTLASRDGLGGDGIKTFKDSIGQFVDLPPDSFIGRLVRVRGDIIENRDDYFVEWDGNAWQETYGYGAGETLTAATMPHTLRYNGDFTWTFDVHEWNDRAAGDGNTNPTPSFVGQQINHMFRISGRLGILSGENVILSVTNSFEDLYRYSCTQLMNDDRVDIAIDGSTQRGGLNYVTYNQDDVIIFSDDAQFKLTYVDNSLGPNTIDIKQTTEYKCSRRVAPATVGPNLLFVDGFGESQYDSLREYSVDQNSLISQAQEITSDVPEYIPAGTYKITSSSSENSAALLTEGDRSSIYFYQYFFNSEGKAQSAWQKWPLEGVKVYNAEYIEDRLYIAYTFDNDVSEDVLHYAYLDPTLFLNNTFSLSRALLDHRISSADTTTVLVGSNSEVTVPFVSEDLKLTVITSQGRVYDSVAENTTGTVTFANVDLTGETYVIGTRYVWSWTLSPFYFRDSNQVAIQDGRFQLQYVSFLTNNTSYFKYDVTPNSRPTSTYTYVARGFSEGINQFGPTAIANEEVKIAAFGEGPKTKIRLYSESPYPVRVSSLEWRGTYRPTTKRK